MKGVESPAGRGRVFFLLKRVGSLDLCLGFGEYFVSQDPTQRLIAQQ